MTLDTLFTQLDAAGAKLSLRVVVDAPAGSVSDEAKAALAEHKPLVLMRLAREAQWASLSRERWGPPDDAPAIVVPPDWRAEVANWPQPLWAEWRAMVTEYLDNLGRPPEPDEIKAADYAAWCILRPETETAR